MIIFGTINVLPIYFLMAIIALGKCTWRISLSFITAILVPIHYLLLTSLLTSHFRNSLFVLIGLNSLGKIINFYIYCN